MRARGFTLVELMVVIAILAGVTTAGLMMYGRAVRGDAAPGFARGLVGMVNQARQSALSTGLYARVRYVPGGSGLQGAVFLETQDPTNTANWVDLGGQVQAPSGIELCTPDQGPQLVTVSPTCPLATTGAVCFAPDGKVTLSSDTTCPANVTTPGATLYLHTTDGSVKYKLAIMGLTGLPRLIDQW